MQFQTKYGPVTINHATQASLEQAVRDKFNKNQGFRIATLNLDHLVKMNRDQAFYSAYSAHEMVVADGNPVVWAASMAGSDVSLVAGADLVIPLAKWAAAEFKPIALLGSTEETLKAAAEALCREIPGLKVACCIAPPFGFDPMSQEALEVLKQIEASGAGMCFLALGAPKQELLAAWARDIAPTVGFASIGAGLDFLAGAQKRAPKIIRSLALEWVWRLTLNPKRLWRRYLASALIFPGLVIQALGQRLRKSVTK